MFKKARRRTPISVVTQVAVFRRDGWLCYVCHRPVILHLALKYLQIEIRTELNDDSVVYWHRTWRRDEAPLADELAASVDHVEALAAGGEHGLTNFATICARCNARKSSKEVGAFIDQLKPWRVKGKHGEPKKWDGLASTFVFLGRKHSVHLTGSEKLWLAALSEPTANSVEETG